MTNNALSKNFYINPSSASIQSNGSYTAPWKTLKEANNYSRLLQPGDSVMFKCNEIYIGELIISASGKKSSPIVFTTYGTGKAPLFTNLNKHVIFVQHQKFIVIDGLMISDQRIKKDDHNSIALIQYGIIMDKSTHCQVRNCDISLVGIGISLSNGSDSTIISGNTIHNLRMIRSTIGGNDDFGANALVIGSSYNSIQHNKFESCWGFSEDYSYDGGAIEFFGNKMNMNSIMYNTSINCNGFIEVGSDGQGEAVDNLIAYNKIINNGYTGVFHNRAKFNTIIKKTKYYNNVIIETKRQFAYPNLLFWTADPTAIDMIEFKNNIVWLETGIAFGINSKQILSIHHSNNVFKMLNGSYTARNLNPTDKPTRSAKIFHDSNGEVETWDLRLANESCAIDAGIQVGIAQDFSGNPIDEYPDAGIYEYRSTLTLNKKPVS